MSFFSRLFRGAPSRSPNPASSSEKPEPASAKPNANDRALTAAAEERALQSAIESRDVQAVARLVVAGVSTRIRQTAAEAIDDPDVVRQLIRDVRGGNDKNVYRILTSKRDALLEQARRQEQLRARIDEVAGDIERHGRRAIDALYGSRLDELESRWSALAPQADPESSERIRRWIERSRQTLAEHERQAAEQAAQEQAAAEAAAQAQRLREEQALVLAAAAAEHARSVEEQRRALEEQQQAEQRTAREIGELIRKTRSALSSGGTSRAAGLRRTIEEKLAGGAPLSVHLAGQIQQLDRQLDELKDWKTFSVTPKRAELIEEMESLVGSTLEPLALADEIKRLQDEWRTLGKGAGEHLDSDAQRFQDATRKAFEPCREYFDAQARVREENLRRRDELLDRLKAFDAQTDWERPDWRLVIKTLRESQQQWRNFSSVDPRAARQQEAGFAALTANLQVRLDAEYARNVRQKESLIERAKALLAADDGRKAIEAVKELQQAWQTVGPVPRERDQRLWTEFRKHSDAVFQKRQQDRATHAAGLDENKTRAIAVCEQVEQIAALEGAELIARAGSLTELRTAFEAIGELPRAETRDLRNRLDKALDRCRQSIARQRARDAERGWDDLFEAADAVRAYRLAVARGQDSVQRDTLKAAAVARMASVARWPKGGREALEKALADEGSIDLAANESALRMLCIRAEILADLATPEEDRARRRDHQLQRLVQRMGQGLKADEAPLDDMAIEWVNVGPVDDTTYTSLVQRFRRCRRST